MYKNHYKTRYFIKKLKNREKLCVNVCFINTFNVILQREIQTTTTNNKKFRVMTTTLNYGTSYINSNYRIKVAGVNEENGQKLNTLVGVSGLLNLIGAELFNKFMERREKCMDDVCVCKLRRGLKVSFYVK